MKVVRFIFSNIVTLVVALMMASMIWINAIQASDPLRDEFVTLDVRLVGQPDNSILMKPTDQQTVQILIEGATSLITTLTVSDFSATANISQVPFGTETAVPIRVQFNEPGLKLLNQSPQELLVLLEEQISRDIPVVLNSRGNVAQGHSAGEPLIDPPFITVVGSSSRVNELDIARITIFLDNERETLIRNVQPIFYDQQGRVASVNNLTLSHDHIQVTIPVDESAGYAEKLINVNLVGEPAPGYRLLSYTVTPPSVLLESSPTQLINLTAVATEPIDITGLTTPITPQVTLELPPGVALAEPVEIFVEIEIEPFFTTASYNQTVNLQGLADGLTATVTPETVRVVLFGPLPVLDSLSESEVQISIDLFDLKEGVYNIEPTVSIPDRGIEVRSVQPSNLTVEIAPTPAITDEMTTTLHLPQPLPNLNHTRPTTTTVDWLQSINGHLLAAVAPPTHKL